MLAACVYEATPERQPPVNTSGGAYSPAIHIGNLSQSEIREASGMASSGYSDKHLWVLNDGGAPASLHAFTTDGEFVRTIKLDNARNRDWEDLASFAWDGKNWLLVADVGDNAARRKYVSLYLLEEPGLATGPSFAATKEIRLTYPDGPRDCEAVAVDTKNNQILLLSKRTIPALLYAVPLADVLSDEILVAELLDAVTSIPQPTADDIRRALPEQNWHWQPTAMDISADGSKAAILTYPAVYVFARHNGESWIAAMQREPVRLDMGSFREAEAVAFNRDGSSLFITTEGRNPPLVRFDLLH